MTNDELVVRKAEIAQLIDEEGADLDALETECRAINEELETRANAEAQKAEIRKAVAMGEGEVIEKIEEVVEEKREIMENIEVRNTKEYIDAYANYIKTNNDAECRALLSENATSDGQVPVPELVYDEIKNAWEKEGIMRRVKKAYLRGNLKIGFEIDADPAYIHAEGDDAVTEEDLTLGIVELVPQSIKKWISISDETLDLAGESFLRFVYDELAYEIAKKAADTLIADIVSGTTTGSTSKPAVAEVKATAVSIDLVAKALASLSDRAENPVIMMNKATWADFKAVQYANKYGVDPFEGLEVEFNNTIKSFSAASTGDTFAIVGDLGYGALANFPNGEDITFKFDDKSLAEKDLVKVLGRKFIGMGVVAPKAFAKIVK